MSRQCPGNVKAMSRQGQGKVKTRFWASWWQGQGKEKSLQYNIPNLNHHEYMKENAIGQPLFRGPHLSFLFWRPLVWASVSFGTYQVVGASQMGWSTYLGGESGYGVFSLQTLEPDWPRRAVREFYKNSSVPHLKTKHEVYQVKVNIQFYCQT